jgi:hypothetical protein
MLKTSTTQTQLTKNMKTELKINDLVIRLSDGVEALVINPDEGGKVRVRFDDDEEELYSAEELAAYDL